MRIILQLNLLNILIKKKKTNRFGKQYIMMKMIRRTLQELLIFVLTTEIIYGCTITSSSPSIQATVGDYTELQWDVLKPHDMIFGGIDCTHDGKLIASSDTANFFKLSKGADPRLSTLQGQDKYTVRIKDLKQTDSGNYKCSILCISTRGNFYSHQIKLTVQEKVEGEKNNMESQQDDDGGEGWTTKKRTIVIAMAAVSFVLFVLVIIVLVLCIKKKFYKFVFNKQPSQKEKEAKETPADFEEQQYADLSTFQSAQYSELNIKSALWTNHDYESIPALLVKKISNGYKKGSVSSAYYEDISDPSTPLKKASVDFM